mgnify:FL=1
MADTEAPTEKPAQALPMTVEDFQGELDDIVHRAKAAGLRPLRLMARYIGRQGLNAFDSILAGLEDGSVTGKKK